MHCKPRVASFSARSGAADAGFSISEQVLLLSVGSVRVRTHMSYANASNAVGEARGGGGARHVFGARHMSPHARFGWRGRSLAASQVQPAWSRAQCEPSL